MFKKGGKVIAINNSTVLKKGEILTVESEATLIDDSDSVIVVSKESGNHVVVYTKNIEKISFNKLMEEIKKTKPNHNQNYLLSIVKEDKSNSDYIIISQQSHWIDIAMGRCLKVSVEQFRKIYEILGE